ncbi:MAG: hypothetical protein QOD75_1039 [Blastocatellia bacterium]|jgi:hypothetical protein|nr:hypothetical protein [Blastocatellia bacterium]
MRLKQAFRSATVFVGAALLALGALASTTHFLQRTKALPYCEVARNAERYHGQFVTVRARVILGSEGIYIFEDCDPVSALASLVAFDDNSERRMTRSYVEEILVVGNPSPAKQADAIIAGRFNGEFSTGCWGPAFQIVATKIELVSPVTEYDPVTSADSGLRTRH